MKSLSQTFAFVCRYQELEDLEDAVSSCATPENPLSLFDTSCFSGIYVTGENIDDDYFKRLHERRNDSAKQKNGDNRSRPRQSNDGCESVSNDKRIASEPEIACEPIQNQPASPVR